MTANTTEKTGFNEDITFALHAVFAYCISVVLIIFLGSRIQLYNINLGLFITEVVFIALPAGVVLFIHRQTVDGKLFSFPKSKQLSLTILIGLCITIIAILKSIAIRKTLSGIDTSGTNVVEGMSFPILVFLAPLCEELLFRPVIQNGFANHWSNRSAVLLTAILFALFHLSLLRFTETFILGLFIGIVYLKTKRFWCAVTVHILCNSLGPVLWRNAQHLSFLSHPLIIAGLASLALVGCYFIGDTSPVPLKGIWQRLKWAAYGTSQSFSKTQKGSFKLALTTGIIILCLFTLIGYDYTIRATTQKEQFSSPYAASQKDHWTVVSNNQITVSSEITIKKIPDTYQNLLVTLPFDTGTIETVKYKNEDIHFSQIDKCKYEIDLSDNWNRILKDSITVIWNFSPPDKMEDSWMILKTLLPSNSFSLTVTIEDKKGFQFSFGDNDSDTMLIYSGSHNKPRMVHGKCGGLIRKTNNPGDAR